MQLKVLVAAHKRGLTHLRRPASTTAKVLNSADGDMAI